MHIARLLKVFWDVMSLAWPGAVLEHLAQYCSTAASEFKAALQTCFQISAIPLSCLTRKEVLLAVLPDT